MKSRELLREYSGYLNLVARLLDLLGVLFGGLLAYLWRFGNLDVMGSYRLAMLLGLLTVAVVFPVFGLYRSWRGRGRWVHAQTIVLAWCTVLGILVGVAYLTKSGDLISRKWTIAWGLAATGGLLAIRFTVWGILGYLRRHGQNFRRIVIYGAGALGCDIRQRLQEAAWIGLEVVGFFDDNSDMHGKLLAGKEVLGGLDRLADVVQATSVDEVWIALPLREEVKVRDIVHELRHSCVTIRYVPDIFTFRLLNHSMTDIGGFAVLNLTETPMRGGNRFVKAVEDRVLAAVILFLISPLMLVLALGVKLSSPGPVFYRQERVGWNGTPFMMLKFRSMPVDVENGGVQWGGSQGKTNTRFGAFIRKTSLDELPQFLNVLRGDMSIVGPRPERTIFVEKFKEEIPDYMKKHLVKAGITGWAQINGWRGDTDLNKRIEYDLYYIEHWSLGFDLKIIFLTIFRGFVNKNAY
ncbi:MAG: undecaprenyl-phosphate glucose phosphotransferase [Gammaproteobacteria bacterium HGW-Gammaproteobacteria-1]|nr:MAG: undecaprenyl-phosphate glucose phosphotransferase [Gammaproteobacteria bacterium HGW-Gammaproteobacteria-1]